MRSTRTTLRRRGLAGGAIVAVLAGLLFVAPGVSAAGPVRAGSDQRLNPEQNPLRGKSGPVLAVNPSNPDHIVEMHQDLLREECQYNVSTDGGKTWTGGEFEAPADFPNSSPGPCSVLGHGAQNVDQSGVVIGSGQNVYATFTANKQANVSGYSLLFARSSNGGRTFGVASVVAPGGATGTPDYAFPEMTVDRGAGTGGADRIYIAFEETRAQKAFVVRSDDGGATWGSPVEASNSEAAAPVFDCSSGTCTVVSKGDAHRKARELSEPVLGPAGSGGAPAGVRLLYLAWRSFHDTKCPAACVGQDAGNETAGENEADGYLVLAKSFDNGATWTRTRAVNVQGYIYRGPVTPPYSRTPTFFEGSNFPRMAVHPNGSLLMTYNQGPGVPSAENCGTGPFPGPGPGTKACPSYGAGAARFRGADHFIHNDHDVWFLRSSDGGDNWTNPKQINDPKQSNVVVPEVTQTRHPFLSVTPSGRIDLVWHDRRHWYLNPSDRADRGGRCTHTHVACEEARLGDTYYVSSDDGGATFSPNRRLNDRSHNNDVGFDYRFSTYWDYGPVVVPIGANRLLVASHDSREGNFDNDTQDIYTRTVELNATGPAPVDNVGSGTAADLTVALSRRANPGGSEGRLVSTFASRPVTKVVIVNEGDVAGAVVGGVLARANMGPLLASPAGGLPASVKAEVDRMDPIGAFIIGDTGSLSGQVEADLAAAGVPANQIVRVGRGPVDNAALVARTLLDRRTGGDRAQRLPAYDAVIVANPDSPDVAAASVLAANRRLPVLYVGLNSIPPSTTEAINSLAITKTLVVGGAGAVSDAVLRALPGASRLATSDAVLRESVGRGLPKNIVFAADAGKPMHAALLGAFGARVGGLLAVSPGGDPAAAEAAVNAATPGYTVDEVVSSSLTTVASRPGALAPRPAGASGYRLVAGDGGIFTFGERSFHGSTGDIRLNSPIVGAATDPSSYDGYWAVAADGGVFAFNAPFFGSLGGVRLSAPAVEIEPTPTGRGYWIVLADGRVFPFGDARNLGDLSGKPLNRPIIGMTTTPSGNGYWLVGQDGGIFNFGDAEFLGSTGDIRLNAPVIDIAATPDGGGYYVVAGDGGVFTFGTAAFKGSTGDIRLNSPVVAFLADPDGDGYWLGARDGGVFAFGGVEFLGSMGGTRLNSPILDMVS